MPSAASVHDIIARIPGWEADDLRISRLGKGGVRYLIDRHGERFVLRISGPDAALLGINRAHEYAATVLAASRGLGPEVVHFLKPEGHLVTRFIAGREWSREEFGEVRTLDRLAKALRRVHGLPPLHVSFSPFRVAESYVETAGRLGIAPPSDWEQMKSRMAGIEAAEQADRQKPCLCHNDLAGSNILDDGTVRVLDWEFAGMGSPYFDLATVAMSRSLTPEEECRLLNGYFGDSTSRHRERLQRMKPMRLLFSAARLMVYAGASEKRGDPLPGIESEFATLRRHLDPS